MMDTMNHTLLLSETHENVEVTLLFDQPDLMLNIFHIISIILVSTESR